MLHLVTVHFVPGLLNEPPGFTIEDMDMNKSVLITEGRERPERCSLADFITANRDTPEILLELCSRGMVVVGGGAAPVFHIQLAR